MSTFEAQYGIGETVLMDNRKDNTALVVAIEFSGGAASYKCEYWEAGDLKIVWLHEWRLKLA